MENSLEIAANLLSIASKCLEDFWYWLNLYLSLSPRYMSTRLLGLYCKSHGILEHITSGHSEILPLPSWWVSPPFLTSCCAGDSLKFTVVGGAASSHLVKFWGCSASYSILQLCSNVFFFLKLFGGGESSESVILSRHELTPCLHFEREPRLFHVWN